MPRPLQSLLPRWRLRLPLPLLKLKLPLPARLPPARFSGEGIHNSLFHCLQTAPVLSKMLHLQSGWIVPHWLNYVGSCECSLTEKHHKPWINAYLLVCVTLIVMCPIYPLQWSFSCRFSNPADDWDESVLWGERSLRDQSRAHRAR